MTAPTSSPLPSLKRIVRPDASIARGCRPTPYRFRRLLGLAEVPVLGPADGADAAAQPHRPREVPRVLGEIGHHVVAARVAARIAGEGQARQAAVANGRKEVQRVPPSAPGGPRLRCRLQDREAATLLS